MPKKIKDTTEIKILEFEYTIRPAGNSAHILVPKGLAGKRVRVRLEVID